MKSQKHYCIFEINKDTKKHSFVTDFGANYKEAVEICESMNNFRKQDMHVYFCVRCLEKEEFDNLENYNPFLQIVIQICRKND